MGLNLQNSFLTLPDGTEFPGTMQDLGNLVAQYMAINGQENFSGINFGSVTPDPDNRDRPWFKTDNAGNAIGWFSWNGSEWTSIPFIYPSGTTADRPVGAVFGQVYLDTDINMVLRFDGSNWITDEGGSGEIKFVRGTDIGAILTQYPGWVQVTDIAAQTIGVAGNGTGSGFSNRSPETTVGEETHAQTATEVAPHSHNVEHGQGTARADGNNGPGGILSAYSGQQQTDSTGDGTPFNIMQPTRFLFCIQKS